MFQIETRRGVLRGPRFHLGTVPGGMADCPLPEVADHMGGMVFARLSGRTTVMVFPALWKSAGETKIP